MILVCLFATVKVNVAEGKKNSGKQCVVAISNQKRKCYRNGLSFPTLVSLHVCLSLGQGLSQRVGQGAESEKWQRAG